MKGGLLLSEPSSKLHVILDLVSDIINMVEMDNAPFKCNILFPVLIGSKPNVFPSGE